MILRKMVPHKYVFRTLMVGIPPTE